MIQEKRITLKNVGKINPERIEDYIAAGGYKSAEKALGMDHVKVIDEMVSSSLRGRGGAGFSAGLKEKFTSEGCLRCAQKYVVCNADEGEPGTFKDRIIMESDPHMLIEGIIIAAHAIGATKAYIYIRAEYYLSIRRLQKAIDDARAKRFLGEKIFGTWTYLDIEIRLGAGSYLCGEELTLLESLEGKRGYPRIKPPFPAEKGLYGFPTLVNNVETLATLPAIIEMGAENYSRIGLKGSPGTKIFTVSGDVKRPGYFETELGVTFREIIYDLAGGMKDDMALKAVLVGGAAGTFIDDSVLDTPTGYDSLREKGATLGSGAVIVMGENRSVGKMTRSILEFFKHESCGKCIPCRVGTAHLLNMIDEASSNGGLTTTLLDEMVYEAEYIARNSLCPLGQSPILPLGSLKKYFYDNTKLK